MEVINLLQKFSLFDDHWSPKVIGELNGQHIKLAKVKGEFVWHNHRDEDEMFLIIKGKLKIELEDGIVEIKEGEIFIVPRGVTHKPTAEEEVWLMLFEPKDTRHTGEVVHELTVKNYERI